MFDPSGPVSAVSTLLGFIFTIMVLSYVIGDNPFFRAAVNIFIGVSVGYILSVAWHQVIWPLLIQPIFSGAVLQDPLQALKIFPLIGALLLLMKTFPRLSVLGQLPMAYLVGVGAAVAVGGAILGTLLPQIPFYALFSGILIFVGVLGTLAYFHFGARKLDDGSVQRNAVIQALTRIGRFYIAISFGVLFAGVYVAALTAFISRVDSFGELIDALGKLLQSNASFIG